MTDQLRSYITKARECIEAQNYGEARKWLAEAGKLSDEKQRNYPSAWSRAVTIHENQTLSFPEIAAMDDLRLYVENDPGGQDVKLDMIGVGRSLYIRIMQAVNSVDAAVARERERCAKIAESMQYSGCGSLAMYRGDVAAAIREGREP